VSPANRLPALPCHIVCMSRKVPAACCTYSVPMPTRLFHPSLCVVQVCAYACNGLRVDAEEEVAGLDGTTHGEVGYELGPAMLPVQA
jgi:hypothetical protein